MSYIVIQTYAHGIRVGELVDSARKVRGNDSALIAQVKTPELSKDKLLLGLLSLLIGAIGYLATSLCRDSALPFFQHVLPTVNSKTLLLLCLLQFLVCVLLVAYIAILALDKKKPVRDFYNFNTRTGISTHKKTGEMVCARCLLTGVEVPLISLGGTQWGCINLACGARFNTERNPEPISPESN